MILQELLNSQALKSIKEFKKKYKEIFDIAIYGSAIRNKVKLNDLDLAIIFFNKETLEKKLSLSQELKNNLKNLIDFELDIKGTDFTDFSDSSFLARNSIIAESFLILNNKFLHEILGFKSYYLFTYSLNGMKQSKKVLLIYSLFGRRGEKGMINHTNSEVIGSGVIKVHPQYSEEFKEMFEKNNVKYKVEKILVY